MIWVNPFYNPGNPVAGGNNRFDFTQPGSGIPGARTFKDGARLYDRYAASQQGNNVTAAADAWMRSKGFDPATANDQVKFTALDWVFRDRQRGNQKTNGFGDSFLGKTLGIAAPIAGSFFGPAGAALGGAVGGAATGGVKGALLGGAGGFVAGKFVSPYLRSKLGFGTAGGAPVGSVAGRALNSALPGTFGAGTPLTSAGTGALGLGAAAAAGPVLAGAAQGAAGGGSVGLFDVFRDVAGDVAGNVVGGLIGGFGDREAEDQFLQGARDAQQIVFPSPFGANSLFTRTGAGGQTTLSPFGVIQQNRINQLHNTNFSRANSFDPASFRDRLLEAANRVNDKREGQAFASLESKLFNRAGASTGTARQIADFRSDIEDRRFARAVEAERLTDAFRRSRLADFGGTFGLFGDLDSRMGNTQARSLQGARLLSPFGINNPAIASAAAFQAGNTQNFFGNVADQAGGLVNTGVSALFNPISQSAASGGGGGFFNPSAIDFGPDPLSSLGF